MTADSLSQSDNFADQLNQIEKGYLKIFLGMSAGVGKTYSMLESAQNLKKQGVDVVIGVINTHGRDETAALLHGLEIIPEKKIHYRDIEFTELDLDAIIKRNPQLVLIDELAHSNVPGSRHLKRWQDVIEILDNGINVFTTLNVQHIESLRDIVESITSVKIRETVPDSVLEATAFIEIIDITPKELLQRLKEGKVYLGDKSEIAAKNFFKEDHLTALREIVLRYAAEKVEKDLDIIASKPDQQHIRWRLRERLLVVIDANAHTQKLIRTTRRLASKLNAPWIALYIDDGRIEDEADKAMLAKNMSLARNLGAEVMTTSDSDINEGIKRIVRQKGITQVIIARIIKAPLFGIFPRTSTVDKLASELSDVDVHIVKEEVQHKKVNRNLFNYTFPKQWQSYLLIILYTVILSSINLLLLPYIGYKVVGAVYLIALLFLSLFYRKELLLFAAILFAYCWFTLFIQPLDDDVFIPLEDLSLLILYFLVVSIAGTLIDRAKRNREMLEQREYSITSLYNIVRDIAIAPSIANIIYITKTEVENYLNGFIEILAANSEGTLKIEKTIVLSEKEKNAALWVFETGREAGFSTETLPSEQFLFIPLRGPHQTVGVIMYKPMSGKGISLEDKNFLYTISHQMGSQIEYLLTEERSKQQEILRIIQNIHDNTLKKVSLEITPDIAIIQNNLQELKNAYTYSLVLSGGISQVNAMEKAVEELGKTASNMATIVQLHEGIIPATKGLYRMTKIIDNCVKKVEKDAVGYRIHKKIPDKTLEVYVDLNLIEILLSNLIWNAIKSSPQNSTITIEESMLEGFLTISVSDEGVQIPESVLARIFNPTESLENIPPARLSSVLPVAQSIARIHEGVLKVENLPETGMRFSLILPLESVRK